MVFFWNTLIHLTEGCTISILFFLIASGCIPALKNMRPQYLRTANVLFSIVGLCMLTVSTALYGFTTLFLDNFYPSTSSKNFESFSYRGKFIIAGSLILGIVPILAFSRRRNTTVVFTCLLLIAVSAIARAHEILQWILNLTGKYKYNRVWYEEPDAKWYRLAFAVVFFLICYWLTRRKISRA